MKILVIFTGGTIGSRVDDGWVGIDDRTNYTLLEASKYDRDEFVTVSPYTVLSEHLSAQELNLLQDAIQQYLAEDYDGIIVTHGTDTLQYSAAAVEYAFGDCNIPIVFVSSDYPLEDVRTNGHANFEAAVEFIRAKKGGGVFVSYRNENETKTDLHIATRVLAHGECSADLFSIDKTPYATYDGTVTVQGKLLPATPLGKVEYTEHAGILCIASHPGDAFSYSLDGVQAVLFHPYHSATLNTASDALVTFCARAKAQGIPMFVANVKPGIHYESTKAYETLGIRVLPYSTAISAFMKLWAGASLERDLSHTPIAREIIS